MVISLRKSRTKETEEETNLTFLAETIMQLLWQSCSTYAAEFSVAKRVKNIVEGRTF